MSRRTIVLVFSVLILAGVAAVFWIRFRPSPVSGPEVSETSASGRPARKAGLPDTAAIPAMLRDTSWRVRLKAANSLREITTLTPARRATLLTEALDRETSRPAAGPPRAGSYVPLTSSLRLQYLGLLEEIGSPAADAVRRTDPPSSPDSREWRSLALGATEAPEAAPGLRELLANSQDPAVRMTAARYLGYLRDRDAIPGLRRALSDSHTVRSRSDTRGPPGARFYPVREQAARALRELGLKVERRGDNFIVQ